MGGKTEYVSNLHYAWRSSSFHNKKKVPKITQFEREFGIIKLRIDA